MLLPSSPASRCCWRLRAAGAVAGARAARPRRRAAEFHRRRFQRDRRRRSTAVAASGDPRARSHHRGAAGRPAAVQRRQQEGLSSRTQAGTLLDAATGKPAPATRRPISTDRARQQPAAPRDRGRARRPDAAGARSEQRAATPRRPCSSRARPARCRRSTRRSPRKPIRASSARSTEARAAVILCPGRRQPKPTSSPPSTVIRERGDQDALGAARRPAGRHARRRCKARRGDAIAAIQSQLALWDAVQNVWYGLSLGSVLLLAAIGLAITFGVMGVINMAHGEMVMLGAYITFVVQEMIRTHNPGAVRLLAADRHAARLPGRRRRRHPDRARHHPLPLRPAAGNAARHLGPVADPAAGGAHHLRPDQPRGRQAVLDERRVRARRHHHHLQPALDHRASRSLVFVALLGAAALHAASASRCAR